MATETAWLRKAFEDTWKVYSNGTWDTKTPVTNTPPELAEVVTGHDSIVSEVYQLVEGDTLSVTTTISDVDPRHTFGDDTIRVVWYLIRRIGTTYDLGFAPSSYINSGQLSYDFDSTGLAKDNGVSSWIYELYAYAVDDEGACGSVMIPIELITGGPGGPCTGYITLIDDGPDGGDPSGTCQSNLTIDTPDIP